MQVVRELAEVRSSVPSAVTFGNFDGVHLGHRALLAHVRREADRLGGPAAAVTFDPHPLTVLRPDRAPRAIDSLNLRLDNLAACGVDLAVVMGFDQTIAAQSADWFARDVLFGALQARSLVVGPDTRFGRGGQGDVALLRRAAAEVGAEVQAWSGVQVAGEVVSSSRVRRAIAAGELDLAAELLSRPFTLDGEVVHGDHRGRTIGFATANLSAPQQIQPAAGVYACRMQLADGTWHPAVTNCGMRPTFDGQRWQVEAHLLDWSGDLYGQKRRLAFVRRLRGEQKFPSLAALVAQIGADAQQARTILGGP
ncbi:MAG: bifunctional riboflavin kinase/FAD synthetase [Deltaproteobacteria bacterium]|nr:bifunctional riboflavin kinase/FAD synthetase [Deltaproteobacteria bacterium]